MTWRETTVRSRAIALAVGLALLAIALTVALAQAPKPTHAATAHAAKAKTLVSTKTFTSTTPDQSNQRYEVYCPKGSRPLGGGMTATPPVSADGRGVFPTSSERLGQQEGWHITVVQHGEGTYQVTLQVYCRKPFVGDIDPVEKVLGFHVDPGQTASVTASCKGKKKLISGGFLTTQFFSPAFGGGPNGKGVYITESRAIDKKTWRVTATGVPDGGKGGQFNPIAYCLKSKKPLLKEVSNAPSTVLGAGSLATSTAPKCPKKHPLGVGGYAGPSDGSVLFYDTNLTGAGTWSVSGQGFLGGGPITAYAYCYLG
jgi:hypothetical protein